MENNFRSNESEIGPPILVEKKSKGKESRKRKWMNLDEFCAARGFRQEPQAWNPPVPTHPDYVENIYEYHEVSGQLIEGARSTDWIGVELEIVPTIDRYELAEKIYLAGSGKLFLSEDRSLKYATDRYGYPVGSSDGFEIVTDYGDLSQVIHVCENVSKTIEGKAVSEETECCGLHVHLSRNEAPQLNVGRMVIFWNSKKNKDFLNLFTRRSDSNFAKSKDVEGKSAFDLDLSWGDRYELVNLTNPRTLELRGFRGATDKETLLACIELASATWSFARDNNVADTELTHERFIRWLVDQPTSKTYYIWQYLWKEKPDYLPASIRVAMEE